MKNQVSQSWKVSLADIKNVLVKNKSRLIEYIIDCWWRRQWFSVLTREINSGHKFLEIPTSLTRLMQRVTRETWEIISFDNWVGITKEERYKILLGQRGICNLATKEDLQGPVCTLFIAQKLSEFQKVGKMTRFRYAMEELISEWNRIHADARGFHIPINLNTPWQLSLIDILWSKSWSSIDILTSLWFKEDALPWKDNRWKIKSKRRIVS
jgi:hypothetical protein